MKKANPKIGLTTGPAAAEFLAVLSEYRIAKILGMFELAPAQVVDGRPNAQIEINNSGEVGDFVNAKAIKDSFNS
jgi:hypothetical protein